MNTVASLFASRVTILGGSDDELILNRKLSSLSNISSSLIMTSNEASVSPAENVTLYGPAL